MSSPWPARIEVSEISEVGEAGEAEGAGAGTGAAAGPGAGPRACLVRGDVVYLTSLEQARGGEAARARVNLLVLWAGEREVARGEAGWRIGGYEEATPPAVDHAEGSAAAAAELVRRYYELIDARQYRRAYELWGDGGRASGQSFEEFVAGYRETASVAVEVGEPGRIEGAAGSRFVEVPVVIHATTTSGASQRFTGSYTLRRVVVEGAPAETRRWHIYSAEIVKATGASDGAGVGEGQPPAVSWCVSCTYTICRRR